MSLEAFAEQVLREKSREVAHEEVASSRAALAISVEERLREFNAWINSHAGSTVVLPDEAMERESIYGDHGRQMGDVLVDSNVLLRSVQPAHPQYHLASAAIGSLLRRNVGLCVARQNLVEFWGVATRPLANNGLAMSPAIVAGELRKLRKSFPDWRQYRGRPIRGKRWSASILS